MIFDVKRGKFTACWFVLVVRTPDLADLAEDAPDDIDIVIDEMYKQTLQFLRGRNATPGTAQKKSHKLLDVVDLFVCGVLKLLAESNLIR